MESILIKNFGGIDKLEIGLKKVNVFIGSQASGKSVTAKLIYFFKGIARSFLEGALDERPKAEVDRELLSKFEDYFPADTWPSNDFEIVYRFNTHFISVKKSKSNLKISYSDAIVKLLSKLREVHNAARKKYKTGNYKDYSGIYRLRKEHHAIMKKELGPVVNLGLRFIPAGRSFFANLQNSIFSFLSANKAIDPFLVEFGAYYEHIKVLKERMPPQHAAKQNEPLIDSLIFEIIGGKYDRKKSKDYLIHADKRKINVSYSSSGQQETLPLLLILKTLLTSDYTDGTSLFIEEPETHLFPAAQKKVVELLGLVSNNSVNSTQLIITTHSPYVLTSINNLVQASIMHKSVSEKVKKKVEKIIPKKLMIDAESLNAYAFKDGSAESIIDKEFGLIHAAYLDKVSEEISVEFDSLLNL